MASAFAVEQLRGWMDAGVVGTPRTLDIEVAFATWPRGWQRDAAAWLDRPVEGGFTREVVSHFLFLTGRLAGTFTLQERFAAFPDAGRSERAIRGRLSAGGLPVTLVGSVGTTGKDDHNTWTLQGSAGAIRLRDWSTAERLMDGVWQADGDTIPHEMMRPLVLRRQLEAVAAMTRGEAHPLATLQEALAVQEAVEAILAG
jgi:predicted dehydrogenase